MRFTSTITAALTALATTTIADKLVTVERCTGLCGLYYTEFHTDSAVYRVDGTGGCRAPDIPGMLELCVDWDRKRGHFRFVGQDKRCLLKGTTVEEQTSPVQYRTEWREDACNWRLVSNDTEEGAPRASAVVEPAIAAVDAPTAVRAN